ncbi:MAG: galactose-1-phosphate uridylyltransferase [Candidatus Edwardsbacteria bacterium]
MPELRKDPVIGRWVIISTERGKRPSDFREAEEKPQEGLCPFCYGNEYTTPPEILSFRPPGTKPDSPGWRVRVVPNKFPALRIEGELVREGEGLYDKMSGVGAHEVIVETPDHQKSLGDLELPQFEEVLWAFVQRLQDLKKDCRLKYILLFKNHGRKAGATLEHSHSQLIATPIIPKSLKEELTGAEEYFKYKERCVFCDVVKQELDERRRLVCENEIFVAIEPFASRFPFETWILPKKHDSAFEDAKETEIPLLARIMKETLQRLNVALFRPSYNFVIHNLPCDKPHLEYYHWHIEIMTRLTRVAGFERGSGFYINPTPPEEAAKYLREVEI